MSDNAHGTTYRKKCPNMPIDVWLYWPGWRLKPDEQVVFLYLRKALQDEYKRLHPLSKFLGTRWDCRSVHLFHATIVSETGLGLWRVKQALAGLKSKHIVNWRREGRGDPMRYTLHDPLVRHRLNSQGS